MSATTASAPDAGHLRSGRLPSGHRRGAVRTTLRLHRAALWSFAAAVALGTVAALALVWASSAFPDHRGDPCEAAGTCAKFLGFHSARDLRVIAAQEVPPWLYPLPLLAGAFVAGPLIGRELESGTHRLAWTQSSTPARWLAGRLAVTSVVITSGTLVVVAAYQLLRAPFAGGFGLHWWDRGVYEAFGPVLIAYCLFAVAVGALAGLVVRRAVPAVVITVAVAGAVSLAAGKWRWDVWPVATVTGPGTTGFASRYEKVPPGAFLTSSGYTTASGGRLPASVCAARTGSYGKCPDDLSVTGWFADYHPHSHFWYVQWAETGAVLLLAAVAALLAFRVLRRRVP